MAYDDDYWRHRNMQDDLRWSENRMAEQKRRLNDALSRKDWDQAKWVLGVPPVDAGSDDSDDLDDLSDLDDLDDLEEPERNEPKTVEQLFREHKHALLFNLEWVYDFLMPPELREDWARRVMPLDLAQPEDGLAAIEAIRDEYRRAYDYYEPSITQASRQMDWNYFVPRIGDEIERVEALFRHVLASR